MTLGEFIKQYREEHGLSVRYFASLADMSPQQIINIERGFGNDGKPMTSTMKTYQKVARAVLMDEKDFMNMLNDNVVVNPSESKKTAIQKDDGKEEKYEDLKRMLDQLTEKEAESLKDYLLYLLQRQGSQDGQ